MKTCKTCGETKSTRSFYKCGGGKYYMGTCKACIKIKGHNNFKENRDIRFKQKRDKVKRRSSIVNRYKTMCGCSICGYNKHPVALHLNHKDPMTKVGSISRMIQTTFWSTVKEEIRKCEVLCANCHSIHTYEERHWKIRREEANAEH